MASFSFSFSGDDIEDDGTTSTVPGPGVQAQDATVTLTPAASAFPVQGKPQLLPQRHDLKEMLSKLPSKIAYSLLDVALDSHVDADGTKGSSSTVPREAPFRIRLPRRELWDVKVQLMAEEDEEDGGSNTNGSGELAPGLGTHDVKTGIYEGGFKSWESSVDLVKVLLQQPPTTADSSSAPTPSDVASAVLLKDGPAHIIELGCGTALPSLALFHWACATYGSDSKAQRNHPLSITVADYNPSVLYLVTLPNFVLAWALQQRHASPLLQQALIIDEDGDDDNGELELTDEVKDAFCTYVASAGITLSFLSGGWSAEFVDLLYDTTAAEKPAPHTLVLGAETIYSPFALETFAVTLLSILRRDGGPASAPATAKAIIGAKKLYFGVGGSLDDFVKRMREAGATVNELREEADGVRRGVVQCVL
ncbi:hypothetical protein HMPREF1624_01387 [Sporothrix schenckii ATCC 58251]|uniref:protein-histidine N-methyltransferase n=2 Tax=Sporothrix schenckii TaxID=29908 RepID=U7Q7A1_SPOS1|nr:hypothetical protein HMPREF1624_01387 [Sporothrix schenckii ATCC 58251]